MVVMMSDVEKLRIGVLLEWIAASLCSASCLKMIKIRFGGNLWPFMAILETSFVSEELILALLSRTNSFY